MIVKLWRCPVHGLVETPFEYQYPRATGHKWCPVENCGERLGERADYVMLAEVLAAIRKVDTTDRPRLTADKVERRLKRRPKPHREGSNDP